MNGIFITQVFPTSNNPGSGQFLKKLVDSLNQLGVKAVVFHPIKFFEKEKALNNVNNYSLLRPKYFSFGDGILRYLTLFFFSVTIFISFLRLKSKPDFIYSKFIYFGGASALLISFLFGTPYFIDIGESNLFYYNNRFDLKLLKLILKRANGIICVSSKLKAQILDLNVPESKILLSFNVVDNVIFKIIDLKVARSKLGLNFNDYIVLFVGHLNQRKGPDRLLKAIESGNFASNVKLVFLGSGNINLNSNRILFKGEVSVDSLVLWLNSANIFVLPTLAEGNCNSINEALAIGLPIACSDIQELRDQISTSNALFFDPLDIHSISNAIHHFYGNNIWRFPPVIFESQRTNNIYAWLKSKL